MMPGHIYKHIEVTGSSTTGTDDAISAAIAEATKTIKHLHWFQVVESRGYIEDGKVKHWQATIKVGFRLDH
ncbi:MAG: dodecin domain-containing protein [Porticoccaceae bacterium]|nr:dodecin domain-containing protein [Porticoccaceae bacterium]